MGTDEATWNRAILLYEKGKVKNFEDSGYSFSATVDGTSSYRVSLSAQDYRRAICTCYIGQNNECLCKHMIAVAIMAIKKGQKLTAEEKEISHEIKFSGKIEELSDDELAEIKLAITSALRYIKAYTGPSRLWFQYQDSLLEGCNRLTDIFSKLPASIQTADLIIKTLLRLDKKLQTGGVDDSDGVVGGFIEESVGLLKKFVQADTSVSKSFKQLENADTCFGWEEKLVKIFDKSS